MTAVYLGLGSNVGDRLYHLRDAVERLREHVNVVAASSVYETEPVGYLQQPRFLNMALSGETAASPQELLRLAKAIEADMGREKTFRFGPRNIDIDILLFGTEVVKFPDLVIPHASLSERAFVLVPLNEIAGEINVPQLGATVGELADRVGGSEGVRLFGVLEG